MRALVVPHKQLLYYSICAPRVQNYVFYKKNDFSRGNKPDCLSCPPLPSIPSGAPPLVVGGACTHSTLRELSNFCKLSYAAHSHTHKNMHKHRHTRMRTLHSRTDVHTSNNHALSSTHDPLSDVLWNGILIELLRVVYTYYTHQHTQQQKLNYPNFQHKRPPYREYK